jgi:2-C-methyl-D-erythritol 4-phosphate cytidylyltransferase
VAVGGRPLYEWSLEVLASVCDPVVLVMPPSHAAAEGSVAGGESRSESVRNGLAALPDAEIVVVHDAARPLVTADLVRRCVAEVEAGWDAAIAAAAVTDTIKEADSLGRVTRTLDRGALWAIQTPQAFRAHVLRRALDVPVEVLAAATDDAALVEEAGGSVRVVEAPAANIKVTLPPDVGLAEGLLRERC